MPPLTSPLSIPVGLETSEVDRFSDECVRDRAGDFLIRMRIVARMMRKTKKDAF